MSGPAQTKRQLRTAVIVAVLAIVAWAIVRSLGTQWATLHDAAATLRPDGWRIALASALVLATYALLIQSWRLLVTGWGGHLAYWNGARIWTVSNLARYLPGTLWSVGAMGVLADEAGVPPATAAGAAILNMLLNLGAGFVVLAIAGGDLVARLVPRIPHPRALGLAIGGVGVVLLPLLLPRITRVAARLLRREAPAALPFRAFAAAFGANVAAWCTYGLAFAWFARALHPTAGANWAGYVAVYAFSYITGFLALLAPAGLFVRELAMVVALTRSGLATPADAVVLAAGSRLWLTVLEVVPGVAFIASGALRTRGQPTPGRS